MDFSTTIWMIPKLFWTSALQGQGNSFKFFAVRRKWKKYGRYIYYSGLVFYFVFLLFLTSFALLSPNASDLLNSEKQICIDPSRNLTMKELESNKKSIWMYISQYGIIIISSLQLILELIQAVRVSIFY
jgi:hypothetical protein